MTKTSQTLVNTGVQESIHVVEEKKLYEYISSLPHGLIDKKVPGIGATWLEIEDYSRNSIIVFPTRSLAATKAHEHNIHYIGGKFQDLPVSNKTKILRDINSGEKVKIAVVADSFIQLYDDLKEEFHVHDFFLMMDEIDSFQTESSYRPKLEECLDIYFEFPKNRRCLVSATMETFTKSDLIEENRTTIEVDNYVKPLLQVFYTSDSVLKLAAEHIIKLSADERKLFVAFNSIEGILKILALMPSNLSAECGILCSQASHSKIKPHAVSTVKNGMLQHRITFLTSAFFVGLDIKEPKDTVHTIVIADTNLSSSLISISKIRQIIGRVRNKSRSNTLIINFDPIRFGQVSFYTEELNERHTAYQNVLDTINKSFNVIGMQNDGTRIKKAMLETCEYEGVGLLRLRKGNVELSHLNMDFLMLRYRSRRRLYSGITKCVRNLKSYFTVNQLIVHSSLSNEEERKVNDVKVELNDQKLKHALDVSRNHTINPILVEGPFNKIQTKIWALAVSPIDVRKVEDKITPIILNGQSIKELNKVLFQVDVFSRIDQPGVWEYLTMHFKLNQGYSSDYIYEKFNEIARALGDKSPFREYTSLIESVRAFNRIYNTVRKKNPVTNKVNQVVRGTLQSEFCISTT